MLRVSDLPAASAMHGQLSACTPNHGQTLGDSSGQPLQAAGLWGALSQTFRRRKSLFLYIRVVTLARKLLRLISLDLPSEILLQPITFLKFGEEIEFALFQGESYEFGTVIDINVGQLNLLKIYSIFTTYMNVIYKI